MPQKTRYQIQQDGKTLFAMIDNFLHRKQRRPFANVNQAAAALHTFIEHLEYRGQLANRTRSAMLARLEEILSDELNQSGAEQLLHGITGAFNQSLNEAVAWSDAPAASVDTPAVLPEGMRIYYVEAHTEQRVHAGPLGFTHDWPTFAIGDSPRQAEARTIAHYAAMGLTVKCVKVAEARQQNLRHYVDPEWMIGYAEDVVRSPRAPYVVLQLRDQGGEGKVVRRYEDVANFAATAPARLGEDERYVVLPAGAEAAPSVFSPSFSNRHETLGWLGAHGAVPLSANALARELLAKAPGPAPAP